MTAVSFADFDLDPRILRAIAKLEYQTPTLVQQKTIPLGLEGKDILARARTGTGKTASYCIPTVQKILINKEALDPSTSDYAATRAVMLVPTRELAEQVHKFLKDLTMYCSKEITSVNLAGDVPIGQQKPFLDAKPDVIVSTPSRLLLHIESGNLHLQDTLTTLVIDEADLVLSYGYDEDLHKIISRLPRTFQTYLMSATLNEDVTTLKQLVLKNPVVLQLEESSETSSQLTQYVIKVSADQEKFLLIYFILKLKLIKGKLIIFVNNIERCYRMKLFLEQFGIKSCVLNSELPVNSRVHIVRDFNKGLYDILIATDEVGDEEVKSGTAEEMGTDDSLEVPEANSTVVEDDEETVGITEEDDNDYAEEQSDEEINEIEAELDGFESDSETSQQQSKTAILEHPKESDESTSTSSKKSNKRRRTQPKDSEYGISRGIDFHHVTAVVNFDFPTTIRSYTHRIGRTARGGKKGMSISFVLTDEKAKVLDLPKRVGAESELFVFERVKKRQEANNTTIQPFHFDMKQVNAFRYRMEDALRAVTKTAIREARIKEIKQEMLNSQKLKSHFEDNPKDLAFLRHDKPLAVTRIQPHLKVTPSYLLPKGNANANGNVQGENLGMIKFHKDTANKWKRKRGGNGSNAHGAGSNKKRRNDPLKSFKF